MLIFLKCSNSYITLGSEFAFCAGGACDPHLESLARFRQSSSGRKRGGNAARDFHRWVHRNQRVFGVRISEITIPIRLRKRTKNGPKKVTVCQSPHAVIFFSHWLQTILESFPKFFLGGYGLFDSGYEEMFSTFWENFEHCQPNHPIYHQKSPQERRRCIPIAVHGDEGRGLNKVPLLVVSFQIIIPSTGPSKLSQTQFLAWHQFGVPKKSIYR